MAIYPTRLNAIGLPGIFRLAFAFGVLVLEFIIRMLLMVTPTIALKLIDTIIEHLFPKKLNGSRMSWALRAV